MTHFLDELPLDFSSPGVQDIVQYPHGELLVRAPGHPRSSKRPASPWRRSISTSRWPTHGRRCSTWPAQARASCAPCSRSSRTPPTRPSPDVSKNCSPKPLSSGPPSPRTRWTGRSTPVAVDGLERQIGSESTLLDISFLERGLSWRPRWPGCSVTLSDGNYHGTGFRIGDDLLLTNHHVLYDTAGPATAGGGVVRLRTVVLGRRARPRGRRLLRPPRSSAGSTTTGPSSAPPTRCPQAAGILPLTGGPSPRALDRVYVIQHPNGGVKKIGMIHNVVVDVTARRHPVPADTEGGSSGSPVFNEQWKVVGLHHRWGSRKTAGGPSTSTRANASNASSRGSSRQG